jgi:N-hydroxyarylamine O-acetyltransferase
MLLRIDLDDRSYVADVGFGGLTLTAPLLLEPGVEQATPHEPFRLMFDDEHYIMQGKIGDVWWPLYRFRLERQYLEDYKVTSWYLCHHPESRFVTGLIAARAVPGRRYALRDADFAVHELDGRTTRRPLTRGHIRHQRAGGCSYR